ncbi:hypothetical protein ACX80E_10305 [Arthrobacter sp. TMN-49]
MKSLLFHGPPLRALRIALGAALFAAFFIVLGSSGAFAALDSREAGASSSSQTPAEGKGLLSGILSPVVGAVDKTISHVPVVPEITGTNTVAKVVAPVVAVTDRVETTVSSVPVVGQVVAPVVGVVTTPVVDVVEQLVAPVPPIVAPVLDPVAGVVNPVVDVVTGGVGSGNANVPEPVLPPVKPGIPGSLEIPSTGIGSAVDIPDLPESGNGVQSSSRAAHGGTLAEYLTMTPRISTGGDGPSSNAGVSSPAGGTGFASCGTGSSGSVAAPCMPAVSFSPASGTSSSVATGGSIGSAAAHENFADYSSVALLGTALRNGNWSLPASLSSDPGSTPG